MPDNVDDFMKRFGSGHDTVDDRDAAHFYDRFVSTRDDDRDFDNNTFHQSATEHLGQLPDDQFQSAARNAISQAPPQERQGLLGGLLDALGGGGSSGGGPGGGMPGGAGGGLGALAGMLGLGSTDPRQMSDEDGARLMNYARRERPEAMQQVVQEKPWFLKAMGNPVVMSVLAMAARKLFSSRGGRGGLF